MRPIIFLVLALSISGTSAKEPEVATTITGTPKFPNSKLITKEGKPVRFYDDLVKDKVVAINFVFSSCPTVCPLMQVNFGQLQKKLKESGLADVRLVSVTVDPVTDTPARLKKWSEAFGAEKGWTFVTGEKKVIDRLLKKLKVFTADINDHPSFILLGNEAAGEWKRMDGLAPVDTLAKELTELSAKSASDPKKKSKKGSKKKSK